MNQSRINDRSRQAISLSLRLYVLGNTQKSNLAIDNLKYICETHLPGMYSLDIYDVLKNPKMIEEDNVLATPLLIKLSPGPQVRIIGDFSNSERVLQGLGYHANKP